jgi:hypothetical protein
LQFWLIPLLSIASSALFLHPIYPASVTLRSLPFLTASSATELEEHQLKVNIEVFKQNSMSIPNLPTQAIQSKPVRQVEAYKGFPFLASFPPTVLLFHSL